MTRPDLDDLFEPRINFPDPDARDRLDRLIGLDEHRVRLAKMLAILVNPLGLEKWAKKYHKGALGRLTEILQRPPLVVLGGDVGTGKTELASTIGDAVARQENIQVTLFPLSLSTRGQGRVGEMTLLLSAAFEHVTEAASKFASRSGKARGAVILLVDEADALAQSRETAQMHHEDRAGVNAFIRGIDSLGRAKVPAAVIMCTNRLDALDPAVRRRAADLLAFGRPSASERRDVLGPVLDELGLTAIEVDLLVEVTGASSERRHGFTYSDLTQRLVPAIVLDAYPSRPVDAKRALEIAASIRPTPPFRSTGDA